MCLQVKRPHSIPPPLLFSRITPWHMQSVVATTSFCLNKGITSFILDADWHLFLLKYFLHETPIYVHPISLRFPNLHKYTAYFCCPICLCSLQSSCLSLSRIISSVSFCLVWIFFLLLAFSGFLHLATRRNSLPNFSWCLHWETHWDLVFSVLYEWSPCLPYR